MKLLYLIIILLVIYYYNYIYDCGCNTENFMNLKTFKKIIFGKKLENVEQTLNNSKNNLVIKKNSMAYKPIDNPIYDLADNEYKIQLNNLFPENSKIIKSSNSDIESTTVIPTFTDILSIFPINKKLSKAGRLEITDFQLNCIPIKIDFGTNYNNISNSNDMIFMDIQKPEYNRAVIGNVNYNLSKICWEKSQLNWNKNEIKLELRLIFLNPENGKWINIIFPLFFNNVKIENFEDHFYDLDNIVFKTSFNEVIDKISPSMKTGSIFPDLESKNITFPDKQQKLDTKTLANQIFQDNIKLKNDLQSGYLNNFNDSSNLKPNVILQERKNSTKPKENYLEDDVKKILSVFDNSKIDINNIPKNYNLKYLREYLNQINFNKLVKDIPNVKYTMNELSSLLYLDNLIVDSIIIPDYICCNSHITSTQFINSDLYDLQLKVLNQHKFYCTQSLDQSTTYITQPYPYNSLIGNSILKKLGKTIQLY